MAVLGGAVAAVAEDGETPLFQATHDGELCDFRESETVVRSALPASPFYQLRSERHAYSRQLMPPLTHIEEWLPLSVLVFAEFPYASFHVMRVRL